MTADIILPTKLHHETVASINFWQPSINTPIHADFIAIDSLSFAAPIEERASLDFFVAGNTIEERIHQSTFDFRQPALTATDF